MIPEKFKNTVSYSRYKGVEWEYALSDRYFAEMVNGNLICTDKECDCDADGNICLVTPDLEVYHIGRVPQLEAGAGKPVFIFNDVELIVRYLAFCDNDHHHGEVMEERVSLCLTKEMVIEKTLLKATYFLKKNCYRAYFGGSYRNTCDFFTDRQNRRIEICGEQLKKVGRNFSNAKKEYTQYLSFTEDGWVLLSDKNGDNPVLDNVFLWRRDRLIDAIDKLNKTMKYPVQTGEKEVNK